MIKKALLAVAAVVAVLAVVIARQPDEFHVTRSATIPAPPARVFPHVNALKNWGAWDPWAKLDPNCKTTFSGPETGVGSSMSWSGNSQVGEGSMTITESKANQLVRLKLEFVKPMAGVSEAELSLKPEGKGTQVTWSMNGKNSFMAKAVGLFMDCEKMVGEQFEQGLAGLAAVSQAKAGGQAR